MIYSGVRPERIRKLVNLEGFGLPASKPSQAPRRYGKWIDELKSLQRGEMDLKAYDDVGGVARRLMKTNPRLSEDKASWLASHWARPDAAGKWHILGDPAHKITSAMLYRADEALEIYRHISAPTLAVEASDDSLAKWGQGYTLAEYHDRLKQVPKAEVAVIQDAGHMLHHDQPEQLASLIEGFLANLVRPRHAPFVLSLSKDAPEGANSPWVNPAGNCGPRHEKITPWPKSAPTFRIEHSWTQNTSISSPTSSPT